MTRSRRMRPLIWAVLILITAAAVHFWNKQLESERAPRIIAQMEALARDVSDRTDPIPAIDRANTNIRNTLERVLFDRIPEDSVTTTTDIEVSVTPLKNASDRATHEVALTIDRTAIITVRVTWLDAPDHFVIIGYEIPAASAPSANDGPPLPGDTDDAT